MESKQCAFCKRDVRIVNADHYYNAETDTYLCKDCGYSPGEPKKTEEKAKDVATRESIPGANLPEKQHQDMSNFMAIMPYFASWRNYQLTKGQHSTTKRCSLVSLEKYILILDDKMTNVKDLIIKGNRYQANIALLDYLVTGISYFESHPFALQNE